jgi:hypothetical protein
VGEGDAKGDEEEDDGGAMVGGGGEEGGVGGIARGAGESAVGFDVGGLACL